MTDPLVSVLLLTFNRPAALARCLDSLSRQTQQNFEVVLVDVSTPPNHASNHALAKAYGDRLVLRHLLRANQGVALKGNDGRFGRFGAEDRDFCRSWRAGGGRIVMAPLAVVAHDHRTGLLGWELANATGVLHGAFCEARSNLWRR